MNDWMWRTAVWQSAILGISTSLLAAGIKNQIAVVSEVFLAVAIFNFSSLVILWFTRKSKSENLASVIYFLNLLFSGIAVGINQNFWLHSDKSAEVFFGHKIMALMVAVQSPPKKWVGVSSLLVLFIIPAVLFASWSIEERSYLSAQEPWFTLTLIFSCFFVYFQRLKTLELLHEKVLLETSVREWKKFAQFLLGLQHLVNSPLQVIETAAELIGKKHPETAPLPDKIQKASGRLRKITEILSISQGGLHWEEIRISVSIEDLEKEMEKISKIE